MLDTRPKASYWRKNIQILALLLSIWFLVSYGLGIFLVERLNEYHLGGFPLGFWFAQQGSIYIFVLLVLVYAIWLGRLDRQYRPAATDDYGDSGHDTRGQDS